MRRILRDATFFPSKTKSDPENLFLKRLFFTFLIPKTSQVIEYQVSKVLDT